eukprot:TRINITY_DN4786_c0_g1_i2.p2 TRINITY_DN4786_c0_g1~~TRINITY_DN4786_c0_g1_i2.p2  ORF type:complete len:210 (+),score=57.21 TRINITY_DN4786_c0_g1_i2:1146-1775(+)
MFWLISGIKVRFGLDLVWNFFASYHGHSICDSHTGVAKQAVMRQQVIAEGHISKEVLLSTVSKLKNTIVVEMEDVPKRDFNVTELSQVKLYHQWIPIGHGEFECRELSGIGERVKQKINQIPIIQRRRKATNVESEETESEEERESEAEEEEEEEASEGQGESEEEINEEEEEEEEEEQEKEPEDILFIFSNTRTRCSHRPTRFLDNFR